jgi:hypothetical protein
MSSWVNKAATHTSPVHAQAQSTPRKSSPHKLTQTCTRLQLTHVLLQYYCTVHGMLIPVCLVDQWCVLVKTLNCLGWHPPASGCPLHSARGHICCFFGNVCKTFSCIPSKELLALRKQASCAQPDCAKPACATQNLGGQFFNVG